MDLLIYKDNMFIIVLLQLCFSRNNDLCIKLTIYSTELTIQYNEHFSQSRIIIIFYENTKQHKLC